MSKYSFGVTGGGRRYAELRRLLRMDGQRVFSYGAEEPESTSGSALDAALGAEIVILPLPLCGEDGFLNCSGRPLSIEEVLGRIANAHPAPDFTPPLLIAGMVPPACGAAAERRGITLIDCLQRESMTVANAALTAEAAIQTAMEETREALAGKECLILGFGRIGKLLAHRLRGLSVRVSAAARRREDLAWIRAYGFPALDIRDLSGDLDRFAMIFNTVPALVLDRPLLARISPECLLLDLASKAGIDFPAAADLGLRAVWARGLPGRVLPRSAAEVIRDEVYEILREKRGGSS